MHLPRRRSRRLLLALAVVVVLVGAAVPVVVAATRSDGGDPTRWTVHPEALPAGTKLANPGKGWVVYGDASGYAAPAGAPLAQVADLADIAYTRWNWSRFYRDDDVKDTLDWSVLDEFFTGWLTADPSKELAFGVMAENTIECTRDLPATPDWVFSEGAASVLTDLDDGTDITSGRGPCRTPVWTDPTFLDEYAGFLVQLRDHLAATTTGLPDGETWLSRVQFVGANSYGNYGEGHTYGLDDKSCGAGARFETRAGSSPVCVIGAAAFKEQMQMFLDVFTPSNTQVLVPWGSATLDADGVYDWTVAQGMGLRRDGIFGPVAYTRGRLGDDLARAYGLAPTAFERYETTQETDPTREEFDQSLRTGRPSFFGLGFPDQAAGIYERNGALLRDNQRRLGYDFRLDQASFPKVIAADTAFSPRLSWVDDGVDYSHEPMVEGFALLDDAGAVVATSFPQTGANPLRFTPGRTTTETPAVRFDGVAPGTYRLAVGIFDHRDLTRSFALATTTRPTATGWYPLHDVRLTAARGAPAAPGPVVVEPELQDAQTISAVDPGVVARTHVRLRDADLSSGMGDRFNAVDPGDAISYQVTIPTTGAYAVSVTTRDDEVGGTYQLALDGVELGGVQDTWAAERSVQDAAIGTTVLSAGTHTVFLTATGPGRGSGVGFVVDKLTFAP